MKQEIIKRFVRIESERQKLAQLKSLEKLINLYNFYGNIPNTNRGSLWDKKNYEVELTNLSNPMAWDRTLKIAKIVKIKKLKNVLNIGFGAGYVEKELLGKISQKLTWTGIDISPKSVSKMRLLYPDQKFILGKFQKNKFKNNSYDCVIASEVLEHVSPNETIYFVKKIYKLIKKGGYLICSVPLNEGLELMLLKGENPNAHVRIYTPELLKAELKICGFKIVKSKYLYAFHKFYNIKTLFSKFLRKKPNNIILLAKKP